MVHLVTDIILVDNAARVRTSVSDSVGYRIFRRGEDRHQ